jgi:Lysylphosphatidylglycerol synthase TM region
MVTRNISASDSLEVQAGRASNAEVSSERGKGSVAPVSSTVAVLAGRASDAISPAARGSSVVAPVSETVARPTGRGSGGISPVLQNLITYAVAAAIIWYAARGVSWTAVADAASRARLWLFVAASLGGFLCWFAGETLMYSRLFSYFYGPTEPRELLPTMSAVYFLQIINSYLASSAFVLFLHTRKRVPWMRGVGTLLFQAYLDVLLISILMLAAIVMVPTSPIRLGLDYAAGALVAAGFIASFFLWWGARLGSGNWLRWIYDRPTFASFRLARPPLYSKILAIRLGIFLGVGFSLYGQFVSFHIPIPLAQALALTPFIVAIGNSPFSPGGIGTTQLIFILGFARFAAREELFALSLAVTAFNLVVRIPMGVFMGKPLAEETVEVQRELITEPTLGQV